MARKLLRDKRWNTPYPGGKLPNQHIGVGVEMVHWSYCWIIPLVAIAAWLPVRAEQSNKPRVIPVAKRIRLKQVELKIVKIGRHHLVLNSEKGNIIREDPLFVVRLRIRNHGKTPVPYTPHLRRGYPDLYPRLKGPGKIAYKGLRPRHGERYAKTFSGRVIRPGQEIEDQFVYWMQSVPKIGTLRFVIDRRLFGTAGHVVFGIPVKPWKPQWPTFARGRRFRHGPIAVHFGTPKIAYVWLTPQTGGPGGWASKPLLVVSWTVRNRGARPLVYLAPTDSTDFTSSAFTSSQYPLRKVRISQFNVRGLTLTKTILGPGKILQGGVLFVPPAKPQAVIELQLSKRMIGQDGVWRLRLPYTHKIPKRPPRAPGKRK